MSTDELKSKISNIPQKDISMLSKNMDVKNKFICPECGSRSMIKIENKETEQYILKCEKCSTQFGPLSLKNIKDSIS